MDHARGLVFHRPQAASHRRAVVYFCSAVLNRVLDTATAREQTLNLTWQASPRDKFKVLWSNSSTDQDVYLNGRTLGTIFVTGEAAVDSKIDTNVYQATWTRPHTNRLLFEAGVSHQPIGWSFDPSARAILDLPGALQFGPTIGIRNMGGWLPGRRDGA